MPGEHGRYPLHRVDVRAPGLSTPPVEEPPGPGRIEVAPEELELFLEDGCSAIRRRRIEFKQAVPLDARARVRSPAYR
jgi:hypothetical protein